jgi:hypothetical protein
MRKAMGANGCESPVTLYFLNDFLDEFGSVWKLPEMPMVAEEPASP